MALLPLLQAWTGRRRWDRRNIQMSFLTTPKEGAFGASILLLCSWLGLDRTETPKGHSPPPSPKATSCKVQVGSEWGRCILSSVARAGRGVLRRLTQKNQDSRQPAPPWAEAETLAEPPAGSSRFPQLPCLSGCACAHDTHTSVRTGWGRGWEVCPRTCLQGGAHL